MENTLSANKHRTQMNLWTISRRKDFYEKFGGLA
jgi:hypothetical protein